MLRRATLLALASLFLVACARSAQPKSVPLAPEALLVDEPALPHSWHVDSIYRTPTPGDRPINWDIETKLGFVQSGSCARDAHEAYREWSDRGARSVFPDVIELVCRADSAGAAEDIFTGTSTDEALVQHYPNFDSNEVQRADIYPDASQLPRLSSDRFEIACAQGTAKGICAVWFFRAQYDKFLVDLRFRSNGGGIALGSFVRLVRSVDDHIAALLRNSA